MTTYPVAAKQLLRHGTVVERLDDVCDIERIIGRVSVGRVGPREGECGGIFQRSGQRPDERGDPLQGPGAFAAP